MEHKEQRQPGYYWAKLAGEWIIVEYEFNAWSFMASEETTIKDSFFDEIDENRIERDQKYTNLNNLYNHHHAQKSAREKNEKYSQLNVKKV